MPSPYAFDPDEWPRLADVLRFWTSRHILTSEEFGKLSQAARGRAGSLAGVMETGFVDDVYRLIRDQLTGNAGGLSSAEFRTEADKLIAKYGGGDLVYSEGEKFSAWYAETVFRTNVQAAFAAARYAEMFSDVGKATAEYWLFDAIVDDRNDTEKKCPDMICRSLNGKVFAKDDPEGAKWLPPLHFNCRCSAIELDAQDVADGGYDVESGQDIASSDKDVWQDDKVESLTGEFLPGIEPTYLPTGDEPLPSALQDELDVLAAEEKKAEEAAAAELPVPTGDEPLPPGEEEVFFGDVPKGEIAKHGEAPQTREQVFQTLKEAGMDDDEARIAMQEMEHYTGFGYLDMNLKLWQGQIDHDLQLRVWAVNDFLDAMPPMPEGTTLTRATAMTPAQLGRLEIDGGITPRGYWSATTYQKVAENRLWEIDTEGMGDEARPVMVHISRVITGKSVIGISGSREEMEVLFKPGSRFRFIGKAERVEKMGGWPIIDLYLEEY